MSATDIVLTAAGAAGGDVNYIDDCFATHLYTGNNSTQTINNGIDLAGKGGLVWVKQRGPAGNNHQLADTVRGASSQLASNTTAAATSETNRFTSFNSNGFSLDSGTIVNNSTQTYCSWTFRKQAKFFDVVTYTGNGASGGRTISHNLGSAPGMIILKVTNLAGDDWYVYHRSIPTMVLALNSTATTDPSPAQFVFGNGTTVVAPTSTNFTIGSTVNPNGYTFVAYLFAHDAGGFGTAGTDNVISCGSFTSSLSSGGTINLGYEPQYIMIRNATSAANWIVVDSMRGIPTVDAQTARLFPNGSNAEDQDGRFNINATGFSYLPGTFADGNTIIYMAIRRPMKPPTSGTQVFSPIISSAALNTKLTTGFPVDSQWLAVRTGDSDNVTVIDRLRSISTNATQSNGNFLETSNTGVENTGASASRSLFWDNTGFRMPGAYEGGSMVFWNFRRATGFFDVVCYTGTGSARTVAHNLGAVPELMIVKDRTTSWNWVVWNQTLNSSTGYLYLNDAMAANNFAGVWNGAPTATYFTLGTNSQNNGSGDKFVAYLFATCPGVSKVGSYTGNGSSQTINCGFTAGARFVMIKRTDSTGDWFVWDTARGIVSGNDPYFLLNTTAAEVANTDYIDPVSSGFEISTTAPAAINANGGSFIFMAIA